MTRRPRIKICGLSRPQDIDVVNEVRPDFAGFVFAKSPRKVEPSQARRLRDRLNAGITPVGVFVDAPLDVVVTLVETGVIEAVQLHGTEDEAYIEALRARCAVPIIKAYTVRTTQDIDTADNTTAEILMLDNGKGTGERFDWSFLRQAPPLTHPWFLAGGIDVDNLSSALALEPWGIDVSSGVETDGLKDPDKIRELICALQLAYS
ncbi:MAG: phosphoribosylanthranilate isomerase [Actinomycetia bacterium]|nr:phosphoribosylanthranilate isomerase [Actinomycetes bacterium]